MQGQDQLFLYLFTVLSVVLCICHPAASALYDKAVCDAAQAATASASTCTDWQSINNDISTGDCCAATVSTDLTTCNPLCTTVITGMVDTCETRQQFQNLRVKGESCQILTVQKAMAKEGIGCDDWGYIIQNDANIFCLKDLGKYKDWDTNCTETCVDIIEAVPSYCLADAVGYWKDTPIKDYHKNCSAKVFERVLDKPDKNCILWKNLLELDITSQQGCGTCGTCTSECEELIGKVEAGCPGYVARNEWTTIACAGYSCGTPPSSAAFGAPAAFSISMILASFLAYLGLEMVMGWH